MSVKFIGVPIKLNGEEYLVPSLSLRQVQENFGALQAAGTVSSDTGAPVDPLGSVVGIFEKCIPIIGLAIRRNYPDISDENLWDWIDCGNFAEVFSAVQGASGFKAVAPGE